MEAMLFQGPVPREVSAIGRAREAARPLPAPRESGHAARSVPHQALQTVSRRFRHQAQAPRSLGAPTVELSRTVLASHPA